MKLTALLFSPMMIKAEREGRKTMTRRIIKFPKGWVAEDNAWDWAALYEYYPKWGCPYGQTGDIIWVRETHYAFGEWIKDGETKTGKQKWKFVRQKDIPVRFADNKPKSVERIKFRGLGWYKRSSLFLEKKDCRTFLKITDVRPERLHDISEKDAVAEGINPTGFMSYFNTFYENYLPEGYTDLKPIDSFKSLWQSINGKDSWDANDWVWVISFTRTEKPENL